MTKSKRKQYIAMTNKILEYIGKHRNHKDIFRMNIDDKFLHVNVYVYMFDKPIFVILCETCYAILEQHSKFVGYDVIKRETFGVCHCCNHRHKHKQEKT